MAISTIYPNGVNEVIVPATQSIAISNFGGGIASIYYLIVNANRPAAYQLQQTLNNSSVVLGAFADGMTIKIEAGPSVVRYDVGASPDTGIGDADTLNGLASDTAATADTIAARDSSGDIAANAFESTVATGTAPLTVASTTLVSNLNADLLDGQEGSYYAVDANVLHLTGDEGAITGQKIFNDLTVNSAQPFSIKDSSGTKRTAMQFVSNVLYIGTTGRATNLQSNGTLQYNGTTLASGTIDTTATQTITVVDGLITSIV